MSYSPPSFARLALALGIATLLPCAAYSTDVDDTGDCDRNLLDFGDAPEGNQAYPGVPGAFPTCSSPGPTGTQEVECTPVLSTAPGPAGAVEHVATPEDRPFWLGCGPSTIVVLGIDTEGNGKTNSDGGTASACDDAVPVDCFETAFGLTFGQDECYGSTDAGLYSAPFLQACRDAAFDFQTYSCNANPVDVYLNVLVDWNEDGDWNDSFQCPDLSCAYEWAVKNKLITLPPGCAIQRTPVFRVGPKEGKGWLRITISSGPVSDGFPWQGSYTAAGPGQLRNGETEDYPVDIVAPLNPCQILYYDFGDAPEEALAYPGVPGRFPTCTTATGSGGTQETDCSPLSTDPGIAGYVQHEHPIGNPNGFWFGCGDLTIPHFGVDGDGDGKTNDDGAPISVCNAPNEATDCVEPAFGLNFGQDECYGDEDAGLTSPLTLRTCTDSSFVFEAHNCAAAPQTVFLNVLFDWNGDADWNDNFRCPDGECAYEWAVKNVPISLNPGCHAYTSPIFRVGPKAGDGWMRMTLTQNAVTDDFPWNGSAGLTNGVFVEGETEDYPIAVISSPVGVSDPGAESEFRLAPPVPNPASGTVVVRYTMPRPAPVRLEVVSASGRHVRLLEQGIRTAGEHAREWDFRDRTGRLVPAGLYLLRLRVGDEVRTQRVVHLHE